MIRHGGEVVTHLLSSHTVLEDLLVLVEHQLVVMDLGVAEERVLGIIGLRI